jgi:LacI family transcriptional regulator
MSELNYRPNSVARSLATRQTNTIGLMVPDFHGRYFGRIITAAQRNLQADGRHILVASSIGGVAEELAAIEHLRASECDGLMVYSRAMSDEAILAVIDSYPNVAVINRLVEGITEHCFGVDHTYGGVLAARQLLDCGHEAIACITGPIHVADARERQAGFETTLVAAGIPASALIKICGEYNYESGALSMEKLWKTQKGKFTAVFCGNDEMAVGALFKLIELGVKVPDEVSIIGYDNAQLSAHTFPKLTTIFNPVDEIAKSAANYIRNICYKQENEFQNRFLPCLVERDSVRSIR